MRTAIVPFIDLAEMTIKAIDDIRNQGDVRVIAIDNGSSLEEGRKVREHCSTRDWYIRHAPPLPTLNATWNFAAELVFSSGADRVYILNNDLRLMPKTFDRIDQALEMWDALFVSAVGVQGFPDPEGWNPEQLKQKGGPDYSCFVMTRECWEKYPFDPQFTYFGDNDHHRRIKLSGEGERIFSINIPYLHYGSQTINRSAEAAERYRKVFASHKRRYLAKWGGEPHHETFEEAYGGPDRTPLSPDSILVVGDAQSTS